MARTTPRVENGVLVYQVATGVEIVQVGGDAWQRWLDHTRTTTFRFVHRLGTFTARKEQRQWGGWYWYAYRKQGGRLRKSYLGRAEELTLQRLDEVARRLAGDQLAAPLASLALFADEPFELQPASARDAGLPQDALLATKLHRQAGVHLL